MENNEKKENKSIINLTAVLVVLTAALLLFTILLWHNDNEQSFVESEVDQPITPKIIETTITKFVSQQEAVVPPQTNTSISNIYIWAVIIIGTILVLSVIVLIVRTRRSV